MYLVGKCRTCYGRKIFDIGNKPIEKIKEWMQKTEIGRCTVGYHVSHETYEQGYYIEWDNPFETLEQAQKHTIKHYTKVANNINKRERNNPRKLYNKSNKERTYVNEN